VAREDSRVEEDKEGMDRRAESRPLLSVSKVDAGGDETNLKVEITPWIVVLEILTQLCVLLVS